MRYPFLSAAFLAFASSVVAQIAGFDAITAPTQDQNIPAGSTFDIVWQPGNVTGTITVTLLQGATPSTLQAGPVVAANIENTLGTCKWKVPASSTFATYGFKLTLDANTTEFQYSFPFHITGGTTTSSITNSNVAQGPASTTTVHLSTGPSFTPSPTSTSKSSILTLIHSKNSTTSTLAPSPSTSASSNVTLSTLKTTSTQTLAASSAGSSATSSPPAPIPSSGAAVLNLAQGGLALVGGLVIALAL